MNTSSKWRGMIAIGALAVSANASSCGATEDPSAAPTCDVDAFKHDRPTVALDVPDGWHPFSCGWSTINNVDESLQFKELEFTNRDGNHESVAICLQQVGGAGCSASGDGVLQVVEDDDLQAVVYVATSSPPRVNEADRKLWRDLHV